MLKSYQDVVLDSLVELSYPGVYMVEMPSATRTITAASTSTAAFIGMAQKGPVGIATLVTSFFEFTDIFGGFITKEKLGITDTMSDENVYLPYAAWSFFQNGGRKLYVVRLAPDAKKAAVNITQEDGTTIIFTIVAKNEGIWGKNLKISIKKNDTQVSIRSPSGSPIKVDSYKVSIILNTSNQIIEVFDGVTLVKDNQTSIYTHLKKSRFIDIEPILYGDEHKPDTRGDFLLDVVPPDTSLTGRDVNIDDVVDILGGGPSPEHPLDKITDVSIIAAPGYVGDGKVASAGFNYCENHRNKMGDAFFIADMNSDIAKPDKAIEFVTSTTFQPNIDGYGAVYFPWINGKDFTSSDPNAIIPLPPSGFVAGIYAKIDNNRGVWKAPAGTETGVSGGLALVSDLTDMQHGVVNLKGINALRTFVGYGNVVWGARTVSNDVAWRYIPVRRMANFLKSSIYDGIQWAVFEPNDEPLWNSLRLSIGGFMRNLFEQKALQGATPDQAFFVKCDAETTTSFDQEQGIVNILLGFAPLKPAEFIVVRLSQKLAQEQG